MNNPQKKYQKEYWERENLRKRRTPWHPCVKEYVVPKIKEIQKTIPINKETNLLDVGCGNGFLAIILKKYAKLLE